MNTALKYNKKMSKTSNCVNKSLELKFIDKNN